jgi:hypothetical protein
MQIMQAAAKTLDNQKLFLRAINRGGVIEADLAVCSPASSSQCVALEGTPCQRLRECVWACVIVDNYVCCMQMSN